jgi:hypothetical protein
LAVVFEVVVGLGGRGYGPAGRYGLAVLLILVGLVLLGRPAAGHQAAVKRTILTGQPNGVMPISR